MKTDTHHSMQSNLPQETPSDLFFRVMSKISPEKFIFVLIFLGVFDILLWNTKAPSSPDSPYLLLLTLSVITLLRDPLLTHQVLILSSWRERILKNSSLTRFLFFIIFFAFVVFEMLSKVNFDTKFIPYALFIGIIGILPVRRAVKKLFDRINRDLEIQNSKIRNSRLLHLRLKASYFAFLVPSRVLIFYSSVTNNMTGVVIGMLICISLFFKEEDLYEKCPRCFSKRTKALSDQMFCEKCHQNMKPHLNRPS